MSSSLAEFLTETQAAVRSQLRDGALYEELVFAGIVMEHMSVIGMTFEPVECHFEGKMGNANLRLSGYSISDDSDQLDLFVSLYTGVDTPTPIPDSEAKTAVEQCLRFLTLCAEGKMAPAQVSLAKWNNCRMAIDIARDCRDMLGGAGISAEYVPVRHMLNLESVITYEGTESVHQLSIGRELTGISAF